MAHRAAQLHLGGGAAEVEVPLGEQGGYLGGIDAARVRARGGRARTRTSAAPPSSPTADGAWTSTRPGSATPSTTS